MSAKEALHKYLKRQANIIDREMKGKKRKNKKPEKETEKKVLNWCKKIGIDIHVIESKAVYSKKAGRYLKSQTSESLPDLIGNYEGIAVFIELKAYQRRRALKDHQRDFLIRKIKQDCFACCTDRVEHINDLFKDWLNLSSRESRINLLLSDLPKKRKLKSKNNSNQIDCQDLAFYLD